MTVGAWVVFTTGAEVVWAAVVVWAAAVVDAAVVGAPVVAFLMGVWVVVINGSSVVTVV